MQSAVTGLFYGGGVSQLLAQVAEAGSSCGCRRALCRIVFLQDLRCAQAVARAGRCRSARPGHPGDGCARLLRRRELCSRHAKPGQDACQRRVYAGVALAVHRRGDSRRQCLRSSRIRKVGPTIKKSGQFARSFLLPLVCAIHQLTRVRAQPVVELHQLCSQCSTSLYGVRLAIKRPHRCIRTLALRSRISIGSAAIRLSRVFGLRCSRPRAPESAATARRVFRAHRTARCRAR